MKETLIVTDGQERAALAIVRALGSAGHRCIVTSPDGRSLSGASRYAAEDRALPDPSLQPREFAEEVRKLTIQTEAELVLPISEAALLAILPIRSSIPAVIPFPEVSVFRDICDKSLVLATAEGLGIRVPVQERISSPANDVSEVRVPVVLKPTRSVYTSSDGSRGKTGVRWASTTEELQREVEAFPAAAFPVLAQEVVSGPGIGVFVLIHEGEVVASFSHRRLREKPPSGGVSVLRQSERMDDRLLDQSVALLKALGWSSGVAMVEYKRDRSSGEPVLMEINGRFWGSLQLAIDAGVNFPGLLAKIALGDAVDPVRHYSFVRSRWLWGDVDHLIAILRDSRMSRRQKWNSVRSWFRAFGPGYRSEICRPGDLQPFLRESVQWARQVIGR